MKHRILSLAVSLTFALGLALPAAAQAPKGAPLTVFAAASLKNALDDAAATYAKETGAPAPKISYAASSALARQIEQGAPADVFISADADWVDYLQGKNLIQPGSRHDLFTNRLALVGPKDAAVTLQIRKGFPLAQALGAGRLAMAGPDVPAGKYGQASLEALGVWDSVKGKTARGENVRATLQFVSKGEAPLGIVYDTDAMSDPSVKIVDLFPDDTHPKIVYPGAAISKNPADKPFLDWLHSAKGAAVFKKYGFASLK